MPVTDETLIWLAVMVVNYIMLWKSNDFAKRLAGDIVFMVLGVATYLVVSTSYPWGILITTIAGLDILWQISKV